MFPALRNVFFPAIVAAALVAGCQGCPGCGPPPSPGELEQSDAPREQDPRVERDVHRAHRSAEQDLAFHILATLTEGDDAENALFSPYATAATLARLYAGADGETRTEMADVLGFRDDDDLHAVYNELERQFERQARRGDFVFHAVDALIADRGVALRDDYLDVLATHYGDGVHTLDFGDQPERARQSANQWVAAHTNNRFPSHLPEDAFADANGLILASAIYFHARWQYRFDPAHTSSEPFRTAGGATSEVEMMRGEQAYRFFRDGRTRAAAIGYEGANVSFLAFKPATEELDFEEWAADLDGAYFRDIIEGLGGLADGEVGLPKFTLQTTTDLEEALSALGLTAPFDAEGADFSRLHTGDDLYVAHAAQKVLVELDEQGGHDDFEPLEHRAGARGQTMHFDRPFYFAVYDQATDTILLLGRFVRP